MFGQQGACVRDVRTSTGRLYYRYARRRPSLAGSRASLLYERIPTRSLHNFPNGSYPPTTVVCCKLTKKVTRQGSEAPIYSPSACVRPQPRHGIARFLHLGLHALHSGKGNIRVQNELCNPYLSASAPQAPSAHALRCLARLIAPGMRLEQCEFHVPGSAIPCDCLDRLGARLPPSNKRNDATTMDHVTMDDGTRW